MRISVAVRPKAGKSEVEGYDEEKCAYKVSLRSAPEEGKANMELVKLLSKHFGRKARIVSGMASRHKVVELF